MDTITDTMTPIIDALEPHQVRIVPKQDRARETMRSILASAQLAIETIGIERFTTADVAYIAHIPIGTVYRYFADRVAILDVLHPNRHTALEDANARIRAVATYLEQTQVNVTLGDGRVWTSTEQLEFLSAALLLLAGTEATL